MDVFDLSAVLRLDTTEYENALNGAAQSGNAFSTGLVNGLATTGKILGATTTAIATASAAGASAMAKASVDAYANYEQLVGGVETLFGNSADQVLAYANEAYKSAGLSANEYMETVTSFSAALIQSTSQVVNEDVQQQINELQEEWLALENSTEKGAKKRQKALEDEMETLSADLYMTVKTEESIAEAGEKANKAIIDMSDNANKMGSTMESIQNAYNGFAKGNFTMLDNLKLGYGGTKEEMERLLDDATKLSGIEYDLSSYADIVDAIHVIQEEMGIAGATQAEAATTIQGSLGMMKSAWENVVGSIANEDADLETQLTNLVDSIGLFADNIVPRFEIALGGVGRFVEQLAPILQEKLPAMIESIMPAMADAVTTLVGSISGALPAVIETIAAAFPEIVKAVVDALPQLIEGIMQMLPQILDAFMKVATEVINGIAKALPTLFPIVMSTIVSLVKTFFSNASNLLDAAITFIKSFVEGIINAIPVLIDALPELIEAVIDFILEATPEIIDAVIAIVDSIVQEIPAIIEKIVAALPQIIQSIIEFIIGSIPQMVEAGVKLLTSMIANLPTIIVEIVKAIPQIISAILEGFINAWPQIKQAGKDLLVSLANGLADLGSTISNAVSNIWNKIKQGFTDKINEIKEIGKNIIKGLIEGIKSMFSAVVDAVKGIGSAIKDAFCGMFMINSPSKVFAEYGKFLDQGLAIGIEANQGDVASAMDELQENVADFDTSLSGNVSMASNNTASIENNVTVKLEGDMAELFKAIVIQNRDFQRANGQSAFV